MTGKWNIFNLFLVLCILSICISLSDAGKRGTKPQRYDNDDGDDENDNDNANDNNPKHNFHYHDYNRGGDRGNGRDRNRDRERDRGRQETGIWRNFKCSGVVRGLPEGLFIRDRPTRQSTYLGKIPNGGRLQVLGVTEGEILDGVGTWYKVKGGWVSGSYVVFDCSKIYRKSDDEY